MLLARNPCYHPGELLLLEAVEPNQTFVDGHNNSMLLSDLHDVVVLSSQGTCSPASLMQGGDYDGDTVIVIWDEALVSGVNRYPPPSYSDDDQESGPLQTLGDTQDESVSSALVDYVATAAANSSQLGVLSKLHEYWADIAGADWNSTAGRKATVLAELCFHQVIVAFHARVRP